MNNTLAYDEVNADQKALCRNPIKLILMKFIIYHIYKILREGFTLIILRYLTIMKLERDVLRKYFVLLSFTTFYKCKRNDCAIG